MTSSLASLSARIRSSRALERPGPWFWGALAFGAVARLYMAFATSGTDDTLLWLEHARGVSQQGLIEHYARDPLFNHPPPIGWVMARVWEAGKALGIGWRMVFRVPVALIDIANVLLILRLLGTSPWRWLAAALYAISPLAIVLAGQHGNVDPLIATCTMITVLLAAEGRVVGAGVLIGLGAWIKLPGLLAAPAIGFALPRWRDRLLCAAVALVVAAAPFAWAIGAARGKEHADFDAAANRIVIHPGPHGQNLIVERVFAYQGTLIDVPGRTDAWLWGLRNFFGRVFGSPAEGWPSWASWWSDHNALVALCLMLAFAWLRRGARTLPELGFTVAASFAIFYGLVDNCATQYFAWSAALWFCGGLAYGAVAHALTGAFVYGLYAFVSDDLLMRARWDYTGHPDWPAWLAWTRDAANAWFAACACFWIAAAVAREVRRRREPVSAPIDA